MHGAAMKFFSWIKTFFKDETPSPKTIDEMLDLVSDGPGNSESGIRVTSQSAIRQATVYSCIRLISETISQLPFFMYHKTPAGRERAEDHALFDLFRNQPNEYMTASEFWQFMAACVVMRGIASAYKVRVGNRVKELIPIAPDSSEECWRDDGSRFFRVMLASGRQVNLEADDVFCIRGMTLNGRDPISPIKYMANSIGLSLAAIGHTSKFFKNGARPSGIIELPGSLNPDKVKELRESWEAQHGNMNSGRTAVLTGGMKFAPVSMTNEDAQLLELMGFNRTEICGIFGVPPHMVGAIDKSSSWGTGLAEQSLGFIKYTIGPWLVRLQQSASRDFLSKPERKTYYFEFLTEQFLMADSKSRYESYKVSLGSSQGPGFMTINEVRKLENLPEVPNGNDIYMPPTGKKEVDNAQIAEQNAA